MDLGKKKGLGKGIGSVINIVLQVVGTSAGIMGSLLTVFKRRGCWIAFMVSNLAFVALFIISDIYVPILQYCVFIPLNVIGWIKWGKK